MLPHVGATMHEHRISTSADQTIEEAPVPSGSVMLSSYKIASQATGLRHSICYVRTQPWNPRGIDLSGLWPGPRQYPTLHNT